MQFNNGLVVFDAGKFVDFNDKSSVGRRFGELRFGNGCFVIFCSRFVGLRVAVVDDLQVSEWLQSHLLVNAEKNHTIIWSKLNYSCGW